MVEPHGRYLRLEMLESRRPLAALDIQVWADSNANGIREPAETDAVDSVLVEVWDAKDLDIGDDNDVRIGRFITGADQTLKLEDLPESHYYIRARHPVGYAFSRAPTEPGEDDFVTAIDPGSGLSSLFYLAETTDKTLGVAARGSAPGFGMAFPAGSTDGVIGSSLVDTANSVATSPDGNLVVAGSFVGLADFDSGSIAVTSRSAGLADAFVAKYTPAGTLIWLRTFGGTGQDEFRSVAVGPDGSVVAVGAFSKRVVIKEGVELLSVGSTDVFITRLSADGDVQWAHGVGASSGDVANSVTISADGQITVGGRFRLTVDFDPSSNTDSHTSLGGSDAFLSRYDANGAHQWTESFGGIGSSDEVLAIREDSKSRLVVSGRFSDSVDFDWSSNEAVIVSAGKSDAFIMQVSKERGVNWVTAFQGSDHVQSAFIEVDDKDEIIVSGGFRGGVDFDLGEENEILTSAGSVDIYVARLAVDGKLKWAKRAGGEGSDQPLAVTLDQAGNIVLTGYLTKVADLDPGPGQWIANPKDKPGFVVKLDTGGDFLYAASIGGIGNGVAAHDQNDIVVVGNFVGNPEFAANYRLTSAGGSDIFVVRYEANNPPVAYSQNVNALEDIPLEITLTGGDGDDSKEQQVVYEIRTLPAKGSIHKDKVSGAIKADDLPYRLAADSVYFLTAKDEVATDRFTFQVVDDGGIANGGSNTSDPATVEVKVTPVNDAPIAHDVEVTTLDRVRLGIQLSAEDGDPEVTQRLTYFVDSLPEKGRLFADPNRVFSEDDLPIRLSGSTVYFENHAGLLELQSFKFHVSDDGGTENDGVDTGEQATVSIIVRKNDNAPVNKKPSANKQDITLLEDTATALTLTGDDGDASLAQRLTYFIRTLPPNGTLRPTLTEPVITPGQLPYRLEKQQVVYQTDLNNVDGTAFEFYVQDDGGTQNGGQDTSDSVSINISITPVNDAPIAQSFSVQVPEDRSTRIELSGDDGDPDADQKLTYYVSALPATGEVRDPGGAVLDENDLPFALAGPEFLFINEAGDFSDQEIEFYIRDDGGTANGGKDLSSRERATISIVHVNQAPTVEGIEVSTLEDTAATVSLLGDDGEDDLDQALTFFIESLPKKGQLFLPDQETSLSADQLPARLPGSQVRFQPEANSVETQSFKYYVMDDGGTRFDGVDTSSSSEITVDIVSVNDAPYLESISFELYEDKSQQVLLVAHDGETKEEARQQISFTLLELPAAGMLSETKDGDSIRVEDLPLLLNGDAIYYTPESHEENSLSFVVRANDDGGTENGGVDQSEDTTIRIEVISVNDQPVAIGQTVEVLEDHSINVTLTGEDGDEEVEQELTFEIIQQPDHGEILINDEVVTEFPKVVPAGELTYQPDENSVAQDRIVFQVRDDGGTDHGAKDVSEGASVVVNVTPVNDAPVADALRLTVIEDEPTPLQLKGHDGDADTLQELSFIIQSLPTSGILKLTQDGAQLTESDLPYALPGTTVYYVPPTDSHEPTEFQYYVKDDGGTENGGLDQSEAAAVEITIVPQNDPPITDPQSHSVVEDTSIDLTLTAEDGDPELDQKLTYFVASLPVHGSLSEPGQDPIEADILPRELSGSQLVFVPGQDEVAQVSFSFFVRDDGDGQNESDEASVTLTINAINDRPTLQAPDQMSVSVSSATPLDIELDDVDAGDEPVRLAVSASAGMLTVDAVGGGVNVDTVVITENGVLIEAPLEQIQTTVAGNGLQLEAPPDFEGGSTIDLLLDDLGNSGEGGRLTQDRSIHVTITNDQPWTNSRNPLDVNDDGRISPVDTLLIVNWLNGDGLESEPSKFEAPYYDTSADLAISALDALLVINHLNQPSSESKVEAEPFVPHETRPTNDEEREMDSDRWLQHFDEAAWDAVWQSFDLPLRT